MSSLEYAIISHMQNTSLLFEYAELEDSHKPARESAQGELRKRGKDAAARFGWRYKDSLVHGQVRSVGRAELAKLDAIERPEYKRRQIKLESGKWAWVYEYVGDRWDKLPVISSGRYKG